MDSVDRMFIGFTALVILLCAWSYAYPKGHEGDPNHAWFESLKSGRGPCCSDDDGALVADADWDSKDGHYRVRIDGQWVDVPDDAVINEPNRDGRTIVWGYPQNGWSTGYYIRCFIVGAGG